jgi:hypothetical protein
MRIGWWEDRATPTRGRKTDEGRVDRSYSSDEIATSIKGEKHEYRRSSTYLPQHAFTPIDGRGRKVTKAQPPDVGCHPTERQRIPVHQINVRFPSTGLATRALPKFYRAPSTRLRSILTWSRSATSNPRRTFHIGSNQLSMARHPSKVGGATVDTCLWIDKSLVPTSLVIS